MPFSKHERKYPRLKHFDYSSPGPYFVTICSYQRQPLFDHLVLQRIITATWQDLPARFPSLQLDAFVVMPDHVHFILWLGAAADHKIAVVKVSLPRVVQAYKSLVALEYLQWIAAHDPFRSGRVWQRGYFERIIRDDDSLAWTRRYIQNNPSPRTT